MKGKVNARRSFLSSKSPLYNIGIGRMGFFYTDSIGNCSNGKIMLKTRGIATRGWGGVCPPNSEQIQANIQNIFYKFAALKELYSLLYIQDQI